MSKAQETRSNILQKAFALIYRNGYQSTSVDDILETTKVTKGAFYYHFRSKDEMGLAIINELMKPAVTMSFEQFLAEAKDPAAGIYNLIHHLLKKDDFLDPLYGCPVSNFTKEMAAQNDEFKKALRGVSNEWKKMMTAALKAGQSAGSVRKNVNPEEITLFIMSGYWGVRDFGKLGNSKKVYDDYLKALKTYLKALQ